MAKGIRILRATNYTTPQSSFSQFDFTRTGRAAWWARLLALRPGDLEGIQFPYDYWSAEHSQVAAILSKHVLWLFFAGQD